MSERSARPATIAPAVGPGRQGVWAQAGATPMSRARAGILLALTVLTVAAWVFVLRSGSAMHGSGDGAAGGAAVTGPTMGVSAPLFLAIWIAMMIAMMFPAVAPMILMVARIGANRRVNGQPTAPTSLFVAGYLLVWTGLGVLAYLLALGAEQLAASVDLVRAHAARIGGALIVLAGAYQFSRLKERCLSQCRSPLAFVMAHWRPGRAGAVRMGAHHGAHCAGCCWALMALMFPLGMMNIAALAGVTALIFAEKVLPGAARLRPVTGAVLVGFGLAVLAEPGLLPGTLVHSAGHH